MMWPCPCAVPCARRAAMSTEDLEKYETEMELQLYREYRDIVRQFTYVVETERRFYLANSVDLQVREAGGEVYFELKLSDAWVWDMYRPARFVRNVRVLTFKDVNVEELDKPDLELPGEPAHHLIGAGGLLAEDLALPSCAGPGRAGRPPLWCPSAVCDVAIRPVQAHDAGQGRRHGRERPAGRRRRRLPVADDAHPAGARTRRVDRGDVGPGERLGAAEVDRPVPGVPGGPLRPDRAAASCRRGTPAGRTPSSAPGARPRSAAARRVADHGAHRGAAGRPQVGRTTRLPDLPGRADDEDHGCSSRSHRSSAPLSSTAGAFRPQLPPGPGPALRPAGRRSTACPRPLSSSAPTARTSPPPI